VKNCVKKKRATLKKELFLKVVLFSALILAVFGSLSAYFLYVSEVEKVNTLLKERNIALKNFIEARFLKLRNLVEFLSEIDEIRNSLQGNVKEREKHSTCTAVFRKSTLTYNTFIQGMWTEPCSSMTTHHRKVTTQEYVPGIWQLLNPTRKFPVAFPTWKQKAESGWSQSAKPSLTTAAKLTGCSLWKPLWSQSLKC
jgi:hypothetical protein